MRGEWQRTDWQRDHPRVHAALSRILRLGVFATVAVISAIVGLIIAICVIYVLALVVVGR